MSKVIHIFAAVACFSLMVLAILEFMSGNLMSAAVGLAFGFLVAIWATVKSWQLSRPDD
jgi:uncharacterized membrane protein YqjE